MEIIIGRDGVTSQLKITIAQQQQRLGAQGSVPMSVSREHCKISIADNGAMTIENLKEANTTWVNGIQVMKKSLTRKDKVALGPDKYNLDMKSLWAVVDKLKPKTADIRPLAKVYEDHEQFLLNHQIKSQKFTALASATGIFTMGAVVMSFANVELKWRIAMYVVAGTLIIVTVVKRWRDSKWPLIQKEETNKFHKRYACPNCHRTFSQPYDILLQSDACPFCKAKFIK